jgi:hypothetical protein
METKLFQGLRHYVPAVGKNWHTGCMLQTKIAWSWQLTLDGSCAILEKHCKDKILWLYFPFRIYVFKVLWTIQYTYMIYMRRMIPLCKKFSVALCLNFEQHRILKLAIPFCGGHACMIRPQPNFCLWLDCYNFFIKSENDRLAACWEAQQLSCRKKKFLLLQVGQLPTQAII